MGGVRRNGRIHLPLCGDREPCAMAGQWLTPVQRRVCAECVSSRGRDCTRKTPLGEGSKPRGGRGEHDDDKLRPPEPLLGDASQPADRCHVGTHPAALPPPPGEGAHRRADRP